MREIKRQFFMRWDELLMVLVMEAGFFLFGEIILGIVVYGVGERESIFPMGTLLALFVPLFVMVFIGMSSLPLYFNIALGMGAVRRHMVPAMLSISLLIDIAAVWTAVRIPMEIYFAGMSGCGWSERSDGSAVSEIWKGCIYDLLDFVDGCFYRWSAAWASFGECV